MKTQHIKNWIIILLLIVNLFLLFIFIGASRRTTEMHELEHDSMQVILSESGIELTCDIPTADALPTKLTAVRDYDTEYEKISSIINSPQIDDMGGNLLQYSNEYCTAELRGNGKFSIVCSDTNSVDVNDIFDVLEISDSEQISNALDSSLSSPESIEVGCSFNEYPICNVNNIFSFENNVVKSVTGFRAFDIISKDEQDSSAFNAMTILTAFVKDIQKSTISCSTVISITAEYYVNSSLSNTVDLIPVWCINTDNGKFCYNASDTKFLGEF